MSPIISVIVPVYNTENYLEECLESIAMQSFQDFEVLIIDDASTDRSESIANEFAERDKRFRVIKHRNNQGISAARNTGIENASGRFIAWCDSDDMMHPEMLNILYKEIENSVASFVECKNIIGETYDIRHWKEMRNYNVVKTESVDEFLERFASHKLETSLWSKLFNRKCFEKFRFPNGRIYEEWYFYLDNYCELGNAVYIDAELYFYRCRKSSIMKGRKSDNAAQLV